MHPYSTDAIERKIIPLFIAGLAIICAWFLNLYLKRFNIILPWWIDAPSVLGFYGLLFSLFDQYLWRTGIFHKIGLIKTPILFGNWRGVLTSSFEPDTPKGANMKITQTWTKIEILLKTDSSKSHSLVASILLQSPGGPILNYQYLNDPIPNTPATMSMHYGTAKLNLMDNKLEGDYYSGRGRQNIGILYLEKID